MSSLTNRLHVAVRLPIPRVAAAVAAFEAAQVQAAQGSVPQGVRRVQTRILTSFKAAKSRRIVPPRRGGW
jgi:hypothetical protein